MWEGFELQNGNIEWKYYELFSSGIKKYLRYKFGISNKNWYVIEFDEDGEYIKDDMGSAKNIDDSFKKATQFLKKLSKKIKPPNKNEYKKIRTPEEKAKFIAKIRTQQKFELPEEGYYPEVLLPPDNNEKGEEVYNGIAHYESSNTHRFVYYVDGEAASGLMLKIIIARKSATIDRVYTKPKHRRKGYAKKLFKYAKEIYHKIYHSIDLTGVGEKWKRNVGEIFTIGKEMALIDELKKIAETITTANVPGVIAPMVTIKRMPILEPLEITKEKIDKVKKRKKYHHTAEFIDIEDLLDGCNCD